MCGRGGRHPEPSLTSSGMIPEMDEIWTIRPARVDDVPAVVAMLADDPLGAKREGDPATSAPGGLRGIDADPNNELIVAERDGEIVGTMQLTYMPGISRGRCRALQIEAVRVDASASGQGLGREMMEWALDRGRARGCAMVQLTTDKSREDAHRFYDSLGFAASHEGYKLALS